MAEEDIRVLTNELVRRMNEDGRRIKMLEQRADGMEIAIDSIEENIKKLKESIKKNYLEISEFSEKILDRLDAIENEIVRMRKEISKLATKTEVKEIEAFVEMFNPIKSNFVTKEELEEKIEKLLEKRK